MGNMSYCRFRNTATDLADCHEALEEMISEQSGKLNYEELRAAKQLIETCINIVSIVCDYTGGDLNNEDGMHDFERNYSDALQNINDACHRD